VAEPDVPLVCPACRSPGSDSPLDPRLACPREDCGAVWPTVGDGIPLVAPAGSLDAIRDYDLDLDLDAPLPPQIGAFPRGGDAWQRLAVVGMYLRAHYQDPDSALGRLADWAVPSIPEGSVRHALDLGCGPGRLVFELARRLDARVTGLDFDPLGLRWAERAGRTRELLYPSLWSELRFSLETVDTSWTAPLAERVRWVCGDGLHPPFPGRSFDLVTAICYLDNSRDPEVALGQAAALLRSGGHLLLATPDSWNSAVTSPERWLADRPEEWKKRLEAVGLEPVDEIEGVAWNLHRTHRHVHAYGLWVVLARKR
jgi:SAM-dependent methyltransferase